MCTSVHVPWMPEARVLPETEDTGGDELTIWLQTQALCNSSKCSPALESFPRKETSFQGLVRWLSG